MKQNILCLGLVLSLFTTAANAQEFTPKADTLIEHTAGLSPPAGSGWDNYTINMYNYIYNKTQAPLQIQWQLFEKNLPIGWFVNGFCDNASCRPQTSPAIVSAAVQDAMPIQVGDSCLMEPRVAVPVDGDNGVGILRVKVFSSNLADTLTYIINKTTTGITTIAVGDARVMLYPNPANDRLSVYVDKSLNALQIQVCNMSGARLDQYPVAGKEVLPLDISALAKGLYWVQITDIKGGVIAARKFIKK